MQPQPKQRRSQANPTVFLSIFILIGLISLGIGIKKLITGQSKDVTAPIVSGLMFIVIPTVMIFAFRAQNKKLEERKAERRTDPTPWLRREDWAKGEILGTENKHVFAYFVGAAIAVVLGTFFFLKGPFSRSHNLGFGLFELVFATLFLVAPFIMVLRGIRALSRKKKFGDSVFKMPSVPGVIGGKLEGNIEIGGRLRAVGGFKVQLRCLNVIVTSNGKSSSTKTQVLWEEKSTVYDTEVNPGRPILPISFQIPAECDECDDSNPSDRIVWVVEASADVPGVDYFARFEVPIFKMNSNV